MKIKLYMRLDIFNAQTNFQFYIYKNVGVASKKPILIVKFIKGALDKRCQKIQLLLIDLGFGILSRFLPSFMFIIVVLGPKKIHASTCKIYGVRIEHFFQKNFSKIDYQI
jgi:hypothetical protein